VAEGGGLLIQEVSSAPKWTQEDSSMLTGPVFTSDLLAFCPDIPPKGPIFE
jgi:hypothetical protein